MDNEQNGERQLGARAMALGIAAAPRAIEIQRVENGWMVMPATVDGRYSSRTENLKVARSIGALVGIVHEWGKATQTP